MSTHRSANGPAWNVGLSGAGLHFPSSLSNQEVKELWQVYQGAFNALKRFDNTPGQSERPIKEALRGVQSALEPYARGLKEQPEQIQGAVKALWDIQRQLNRSLKLPGSEDPRWILSMGRGLERERGLIPYQLGKNDCSTYLASTLSKKFGSLSEADLDAIMIRNTPPYDDLVRKGDTRALGPVGWLIDQKGWKRTTLENLTPRQLREGVVAQITWDKGGGHSVLITDVVRNAQGRLVGFRALSAHSLPQEGTGRTGIYTAYIPLKEVKGGSKGVAIAVPDSA